MLYKRGYFLKKAIHHKYLSILQLSAPLSFSSPDDYERGVGEKKSIEDVLVGALIVAVALFN